MYWQKLCLTLLNKRNCVPGKRKMGKPRKRSRKTPLLLIKQSLFGYMCFFLSPLKLYLKKKGEIIYECLD